MRDEGMQNAKCKMQNGRTGARACRTDGGLRLSPSFCILHFASCILHSLSPLHLFTSSPLHLFTSSPLHLACLAALALAGCSASSTPEFPLNLEGRDASKVTPAQRREITQTLEGLFGTADQPRVPPGVPLRLELLQKAAGPPGGDASGNHRGLFRQHCVGCHGVAGDGTGPAAATLDPYPRDFRNGVFKYTSTAGGGKPTREDLRRTLLQGIRGTAMPSQIRLPGEEIESLIEYVEYLSVRGETELRVTSAVVDEDQDSLCADDVLHEDVLPAARRWVKAEAQVVQPPPEPPTEIAQEWSASVEHGRRLYAGKDAQCTKCHGADGDGHGEQDELYDDWNKPKMGATPEETAKLQPLFTLPLARLVPRNFKEGVFHGGDRPLDLYWRICVGIKGTPMPAAGPGPGSDGALTPEEIWHVVHFVRSLSAAALSPGDCPNFRGREGVASEKGLLRREGTMRSMVGTVPFGPPELRTVTTPMTAATAPPRPLAGEGQGVRVAGNRDTNVLLDRRKTQRERP